MGSQPVVATKMRELRMFLRKLDWEVGNGSPGTGCYS
jgi:hypothetical protein